jgi:hypothetical protein
MAREEHDREDLLGEAIALVERIEFETPSGQRIVVGFRANGCASFYFGADAVFHFNSARELRRAHRDDRLYKAEQRQLVALRRERTAGEVQLVRHVCTPAETTAVVEDLETRLETLAAMLASRASAIIGQVPVEADILGRVRNWLIGLSRPVALAPSPHAR